MFTYILSVRTYCQRIEVNVIIMDTTNSTEMSPEPVTKGDLSNYTGNVNHQSEENCANDIGNSDTNTEYYSASPLMAETDKYVKLNKVMYILGTGVVLSILYTCLSFILAVIYACNGHPWFFLATYGAVLLLNLFVVIVSRLWKYSEEKNITQIVVLRMALVLICAELPFYYHDCYRLHKLTLQYRTRLYYKQTLQHVDDLRCLLCLTTAVQVALQFLIQFVLICFYGTETCFILPLQITVMIFATICFFWAAVTFFYCKYNDELGERHRVSVLDLALTCLSVIFYGIDIGSDIFVIGKFIYFLQFLYAGLTLSFILLPSIYIIWFRHYRNKADLVLVCYWKSLKLIRKVKKIERNEPPDSGYSDERKSFHVELVKNNFNIAIFRYNESYTESTMQLILQIAILLGQFNSFSDMFHKHVLRSEWIQMLSIVSSSINLNITSVTYFRSKRIYQQCKNEELSVDDPFTWQEMVIQFFGHFFVVVTRVLAISFTASVFPVTTTLLLMENWILVFLFLTILPDTSPLQYKLGHSVIYTFTPLMNDVPTEILFQVVYFLQNVILTVFWARAYLAHAALPAGLILSNVVGIMFRIWFRNSVWKPMILNSGVQPACAGCSLHPRV